MATIPRVRPTMRPTEGEDFVVLMDRLGRNGRPEIGFVPCRLRRLVRRYVGPRGGIIRGSGG